MKVSEDPEKSTVPGRKAVYRLIDAEGENYWVLPAAAELLSLCGTTTGTPQTTCYKWSQRQVCEWQYDRPFRQKSCHTVIVYKLQWNNSLIYSFLCFLSRWWVPCSVLLFLIEFCCFFLNCLVCLFKCVWICSCKSIIGFCPFSSAGHPFLDVVYLAVESPPEAGLPLSCYPLGSNHAALSVTPARVTCLRQEVFSKGQVRMGRSLKH